MATVLYHHPFSRAANAVWMLEEVDVDYELRFVDMYAGEHKQPHILKINPMGKLPILTDGDAVVTEAAAIGLYLADRYGAGELAPTVDDPARASYLRWSLFAPSVIEPGAMARASGWEYKEAAAGWGNHEAMLAAMEHALSSGNYLLGERFSMADVIFGGTVGYMLGFGLLDKRPVFTAYVDRLQARPAAKRADAKNRAVMEERSIELPGSKAG